MFGPDFEELCNLQNKLAATDYRITKSYEYSLVGRPLPYDIEMLHVERESMRKRINELETKLSQHTQNET